MTFTRSAGRTASQLPDLFEQLHTVTLAVDTEFQGTHTLTVQVATRLSCGTIALQVYHSPAIPPPPAFDLERFLPGTAEAYGRFFKHVILRPARLLTPDLSPTRLMADVTDQSNLTVWSRADGNAFVNGFFDEGAGVPSKVHLRRGVWRANELNLRLVGHFLPADLFRMCGRKFWRDLPQIGPADKRGVVIRKRRLLQFVEEGRNNPNPVLEYFLRDGLFFATRVETLDTMYPYGPGSLDAHCKTFLRLSKSDVLTEADKQNMQRTFRERTEDAYGYATVDAVNTLLLYEEMVVRDRAIYEQFGLSGKIPSMRATLGSRVSTFLVTRTDACVVKRSWKLQSGRALEALMSGGGIKLFESHPGASRYGTQTGRVHGALLYSRSPTRLWHLAPRMLRDVDMAGCYEKVISGISVYWCRPVIFEPGDKAMTLREAVALVQANANPDGWFIRASGAITAAPNALIPSTDNAITSHNYREAMRKGKRRQAHQRAFHLEALRDPASAKGTGGSRPYSAVVESGIVTEATWLMIQALPAGLRDEYENLTADSIVFYPARLAARDGLEFDDLVEKYRNEAPPWDATLDLETMQIIEREKLDAEYVSLLFPIGEDAKKIGAFRKQAQVQEGKGSGADCAWKVHVNSMYGVLASSYLATNNFMAANQITAHARAEVFALSQSLNAIQTITDGCTYRLDQIPACTYEACLRIMPDYPIRRAEDGDGIPFIDPATIPQDDPGFTTWYREHVKRFFGVTGAAYDKLFATHDLDHKKTSITNSVAFDALACDGAANYAKCSIDDHGQLVAEDLKARSYKKRNKDDLKKWLVDTYSTDRFTEPPMLLTGSELLSFTRAGQKARRALDQGVPEVYFPLGLENTTVQNYRAIKASAFVFKTPRQRAAVVKQMQKFEEKNGTGLEVLALRRSYGVRRLGSLTDLTEAIYRMIQDDKENLTKTLNVNKKSRAVREVTRHRLHEINRRKHAAEKDLQTRIDTRGLHPDAMLTGFIARPEDLRVMVDDSDGTGAGRGLVGASTAG